jgi:hypothetical protein
LIKEAISVERFHPLEIETIGRLVFGFCGYNSGARLGLIECGTGYPGGPADQFGVDRGGDASAGVYYTNGRYRDPSAWYHLVVSVDYTNATQANRARIFVNGVNYGAAYNDLASGDGQINGNWSHWIGQRDGGSTSNRWDGYMAELHFLDGITVTDASSFGESDANGVWRPIEYTGSYGTNGFYLKFDPSATNGIGHDHSGNGNNWTAYWLQHLRHWHGRDERHADDELRDA